MNMESIQKKILGCLLGGVIGDAMGAPVEGWHYDKIVSEKGYVNDFEGDGTDDSIIKLILCEALMENGGHATADDFAASFLRHGESYNWFYIPVRNMFHKIQDELDLPVHAGHDNMASSSSAMAISPMGIVNACDPRTASAEAYEVAGLIHSGCCSFCRDGASAIAAAVAAAFDPEATAASVLNAATAYLHPKSGAVMINRIKDTLALAGKAEDFTSFRKQYYETMNLNNVICDSRETVPVALACVQLSGGDVNLAIEYGANFGRDADTIATMAGAVAGALTGIDGFRKAWTEKALNPKQLKLASEMAELLAKRCEEKAGILRKIDAL